MGTQYKTLCLSLKPPASLVGLNDDVVENRSSISATNPLRVTAGDQKNQKYSEAYSMSKNIMTNCKDQNTSVLFMKTQVEN